MDEVSSEFVAQAALIATSGRWDAVNKRIEQWAARPMAPDDRWYGQLFSGLCEHVFSEYWLLKQAYADAGPRDVSLLAWRARNLLELSVWSVYCGKSTANARRLYEDAGRDVNNVFDAFKKWGEATKQTADWFQPGVEAQKHLSNQALAQGIESVAGRFTDVKDAAKEAGIQDHFAIAFKLLSKFAHPTAMQILSPPDAEKTSLQRELFFGQGCLFFTGAFTALEKQWSEAA
jgi:hypothetical protein